VRIDERRPLFCSEEWSAGVESTNGVCTAGVDMTVVEQRGSVAHSTFVCNLNWILARTGNVLFKQCQQ